MLTRHPTYVIAAVASLVFPAFGQDDGRRPIDPDAAAALRQVVASYRDRPGLKVTTTLRKELVQDGFSSVGDAIEAEFTASGDAGLISMRGFTCHVDGTTFWATHESSEDAYYSEPYEDTPYWALLINFQELPFPHLALLWGEPDVEDLCMQLYPDAPWIVPTAVETLEQDGQPVQRIVLESSDARMTMDVNPETLLVRNLEVEVTGGRLVEPGAKLITRYEFDYESFDRPIADTLRFDLGNRQRVDLMAALVKRQAPPAVFPGAHGGAQPLVGAEAPDFVLVTADGDAIDLAALRGRAVVLDFWATWCGPCRRAMPLLHEVDAWAQDNNVPVNIITVNVWEKGATPDEKLAAARRFWTQHGFTLPVAMDYTGKTAAAYQIGAIPTTIIIRPDGIVHTRHSGMGRDFIETLQREINQALEAAPPVGQSS